MAKQPRILVGRVALVTGGARGIGKATAQAFVREGMKVAIGDLDLGAARSTAEEIGGGTVAIGLNVTDRGSFERFVADAEAALGPVDVLVNNAGIMQLGSFLEEDDATAQRMIDINVDGVLYGMKIVLPGFVRRGRGHLVNVASSAGKVGFPGGATYAGTKHFVVGVSEAVRAELRGTGVDVSCVMPVVVRTELAAGLKETRAVKQVTPEDVAAEILSALKVPRFDVYVPRSVGRLNTVLGVLPRSGREAVGRALKADRVLTEFDRDARAGYELRASRSEPGLEPGAAPAQLDEGETAGR
jgi:NADP-dependent 3-hydroxy acid dehydrogenase YdfG